MKWNDYIFYVKSDLFRYCGKRDFTSFIKSYFFIPGFKYSLFMRSAKYLKARGLLFFPVYILTRLILNHYQFKYGISIPYNTEIGPGLYIGHFGGIIVNSEVIIGQNCNINQEVTIGATYGGKYPGTAIIMNNVYFGPGSKIIGGITIGNHTAVGANCVVTKPIPDYGVVVGIPGEVVSSNGSGEYVVNTVNCTEI
jgi:serine O-acetyltransferase